VCSIDARSTACLLGTADARGHASVSCCSAKLWSGIGLLPDYAIHDDLVSEQLVRLLPEWHHCPGDIFGSVRPSDADAAAREIFVEFPQGRRREFLPRNAQIRSYLNYGLIITDRANS
jgi:DNA-binding transcriptional LysR family regulator